MDSLLKRIPCTNCYIDDIINAHSTSKGTIEEHKATVQRILATKVKNNFAVKRGNCAFSQKKVEWLEIKITEAGVRPLVGKTDAIKNLRIPNKNISELRSFFGSIKHYINFAPNLSLFSSPLRPLHNKKLVYQWASSHSTAFEKLKSEIVNITENSHFDVKEKSRLKTNASHNGLGTKLEQFQGREWKTIAFASRFLNSHEIKSSTHEL